MLMSASKPSRHYIIYLFIYLFILLIYFRLVVYIVTCTVSTTQCKLLERKYSICASGWKKIHHQRKLQWVKPPRVQVEYLCQLLREKHHHRKLVPVTTTVRTRCKGQGAGGVHNAAIIVTCVRVHNSNFLGQGMEESAGGVNSASYKILG